VVSRFVPWLLIVVLAPSPGLAQQLFVPSTAPQLVASRLSASFDITPQQEAASGTINAQRANIRANPTLQGAIVATLPKGTVLRIERSENGWLRVSTTTDSGRQITGWIAEGLVDRTAARPAPVDTPTTIAKPMATESAAERAPAPAPAPPRLALPDTRATVPSRDEQLWLQDVMRTKRDRTKATYLLYGGAACIVLGIVIVKSEAGGYQSVTGTGAPLGKTMYLLGGFGVGYGFYSKQKADKQWRALMDEGKQHGFSVRLTRHEAAVQLAMAF
jgi:hypothetical protein